MVPPDLMAPAARSMAQMLAGFDARMVGYDPALHLTDGVWERWRVQPLALREGDLIAVMSSGAYGSTMSSNYNTRPRAAEVLVDGDTVHVIRERETLEHLLRGERPLP